MSAREHIIAALEHLEAAADGDPGRAGLAYAEMRHALTEFDYQERRGREALAKLAVAKTDPAPAMPRSS